MLKYIILFLSVIIVSDFSYAQKNVAKKTTKQAQGKKKAVQKGFANGFGGGGFSGGGAGGAWSETSDSVSKSFGGGGEFGGGGAVGSWSEKTEAATEQVINMILVEAVVADECQWDLTQRPRIISGPGCSISGARLCRGMVICGNKKRLATCSENFCQSNTATQCAKQKGYASKTVY